MCQITTNYAHIQQILGVPWVFMFFEEQEMEAEKRALALDVQQQQQQLMLHQAPLQLTLPP